MWEVSKVRLRKISGWILVFAPVVLTTVGHQIEYEKFKMLHEVIEEADLEDEYQEWRRAYGYV